MAHRGLLAALMLVASTASAAKISLVVEGAGDRGDELTAALRKQLTAAGDEWVDAGAPATPIADGQLAPLRDKLGVARLIVVTVDRQGKDRFAIKVRAVDELGMLFRFGDATGATLVDEAQKAVGSLAPLPKLPAPASATPPSTTAPAAATTPVKTDEAPSPATVETPPEPSPVHAGSSVEPSSRRRKHEYGLLIGGIVAFVVPWIATIGLAAHYQDYNPNAARLGYAPMVGPLLAKQKISDHDLANGYDIGLTVDGTIQIIATSVLVAGILYAAIGVPSRESAHESRLRPLFGAGVRNASLGLEVTW